ncbi:MAG: hypothetical protein PVI35_00930 [Acidimicrobiia bacterium]|jgi:hypothetical protein
MDPTTNAFLEGRTIGIAGLPTLFTGATEDRAAAMASMLGHEPPADADPVLWVTFGTTPPAIPPGAPDQIHDDLEVWTRPDGLWLRQRDGVTARVVGDVAEIGGPVTNSWFVFRRVFLWVMGHLLAARDRYLLHAAAVGREGAALLVLGASGQGKSTVCYAALDDGWRILSDDHVAIRMSPAGPEVSGIPKPPAVPGELVDGTPHPGREMVGDPRRRFELGAEVTGRGFFPVAATVLPHHHDQPGGVVTRGEPGTALQTIVGSCAVATDRPTLARLFPLASAIGRLPVYRLGLSVDAANRVDEVVAILRRLREGSYPADPA